MYNFIMNRKYIFSLLHREKEIQKYLNINYSKTNASECMIKYLFRMLYLIDADEIHYKTVNRMIHEKGYNNRITIVERNAIQECLVRLHDILSNIKLSSANEVFYYITDGNKLMLVRSFFVNLEISQAKVKIGKKKIEVFGKLTEEDFMNRLKDSMLPLLPMDDDSFFKEDSLNIVREVFEYYQDNI